MHILVGGGLLLLGIFFLIIGMVGTRQLRGRTATMTGTVVGQQSRGITGSGSVPADGGVPLSFPVVKFELPGRGEFTVVGSTGRYPPAHRIGDSVQVRFNPADPQSSATVGSPTTTTRLMAGIGLIIAIVGVLILLA